MADVSDEPNILLLISCEENNNSYIQLALVSKPGELFEQIEFEPSVPPPTHGQLWPRGVYPD